MFLSYAHGADDEYVSRLARFLTDAGIPVWYDKEIVPGDRWERLIQEKITRCAAVVVVMTTVANASEWVAREVNLAESQRRPIVPLLAEGRPSFRLGTLQYESVIGGAMPGDRTLRRLAGLVGANATATSHAGDAPSAEVPPPQIQNPMRYTAVWRPGDAEEIYLDGGRFVDYGARYDELWPLGWRLRLLTVHVLDGEPRYTVVWRRTKNDEIQVHDWSYPDFRAKYDELWPLGWRLGTLTVHARDGESRYDAVWRRSTAGEFQVYDYTYADFRARHDELAPDGWRLHQLNVYVIAGEPLHTAVWRRTGQDERQIHGLSSTELEMECDRLRPAGWRITLLSVYVLSGEPRHSVVWRRSHEDDKYLLGATYTDYRTRRNELTQQGWRLSQLCIWHP